MWSALRPYPDELLSSALIRFCRHYRSSPHVLGRYVLRLPGWRLSFIGGLPLPPICDLLRTSADQLLRNHTPLPYAGSFTSRAVHSKCWADALSGAESPPLRALMCHASRAVAPMRKYCPSCTSEDLRAYGESYWHLSHQLPGVVICMRHGSRLHWSTCAFNAKGTDALLLPSECQGRRIRRPLDQWTAISATTVSLLKNREPLQRSADFYREMAESRGYLEPGRPVSESALSRLLLGRFSAPLLQMHGLLDSQRMPTWAALMFRPHIGFGHAPIKHVMLELALSVGGADSVDALSYRSSGPCRSGNELVDTYYSRAAKRVLARALTEDRTLTTEQFLRAAGCYGAYRHRKDHMPKLREAVLSFRASHASVKQLEPGKILFRKRPQERA